MRPWKTQRNMPLKKEEKEKWTVKGKFHGEKNKATIFPSQVEHFVEEQIGRLFVEIHGDELCVFPGVLIRRGDTDRSLKDEQKYWKMITDWSLDWLIWWILIDWLIDWFDGFWLIDWLIDFIDWLIDWFDWLIDWLISSIDWLIDLMDGLILIDWLIDLSLDWLICWLNAKKRRTGQLKYMWQSM